MTDSEKTMNNIITQIVIWMIWVHFHLNTAAIQTPLYNAEKQLSKPQSFHYDVQDLGA